MSKGKTRISTLGKTSLSFFKKTIREKAKIQAYNNKITIDEIFKRNLYFIGVTFRNHTTLLRNNSSTPFDAYFSRFKGVYIAICRHILGRKFSRKTHRQPLVYAFIDDEGTRHRNGMVDEEARYGSGIRAPFSNLHIHAVMLLPQWTSFERLRFNALVKDRGFIHSLRDFDIDSFHVELYEPDKGLMKDAISYAAKGYTSSSALESRYGDMWRSYPVPRNRRKIDGRKIAGPKRVNQREPVYSPVNNSSTASLNMTDFNSKKPPAL